MLQVRARRCRGALSLRCRMVPTGSRNWMLPVCDSLQLEASDACDADIGRALALFCDAFSSSSLSSRGFRSRWKLMARLLRRICVASNCVSGSGPASACNATAAAHMALRWCTHGDVQIYEDDDVQLPMPLAK